MIIQPNLAIHSGTKQQSSKEENVLNFLVNKKTFPSLFFSLKTLRKSIKIYIELLFIMQTCCRFNSRKQSDEGSNNYHKKWVGLTKLACLLADVI